MEKLTRYNLLVHVNLYEHDYVLHVCYYVDLWVNIFDPVVMADGLLKYL